MLRCPPPHDTMLLVPILPVFHRDGQRLGFRAASAPLVKEGWSEEGLCCWNSL